MLPYIHIFMDRNIDGPRLLMLTHGDLQQMGLNKLGVRTAILQSIELLSQLVSYLNPCFIRVN